MADTNTPTQSLPHARILLDGQPIAEGAPYQIGVTGGYEIVFVNAEAAVHYTTGGAGTLSVSGSGGVGTDELDSAAPVLAISLDAPTA